MRQRVRALQGLAQAVADGQLQLQPGADLPATLAALTALPGIGDWSAQLIALRCLGWPDAWPATDIALLKALGQAAGQRDPAAGIAAAEAWRPWRGYAVFKLWLALETPAAALSSHLPHTLPHPLQHTLPHTCRTPPGTSMTIHPHLQAQARIDTPLGTMTAAATAAGLAGLWFDGQAHHPGPLAVPDRPRPPPPAGRRARIAGLFQRSSQRLCTACRWTCTARRSSRRCGAP